MIRQAATASLIALALLLWLPMTADAADTAHERGMLVARAVEQVSEAMRSDDALIRTHAMEAAIYLPDPPTPLVRLGLADAAEPVRFAAAAAAAHWRMTPVREALRARLEDPSPSVRAAAMLALRRLGENVDLTPLAGLLASREPQVRANAAMLLGRFGDKTAIPMLRDLARRPMRRARAEQAAIVRLQFAEAMVRLGDEQALDAIRAAAFSPITEVRVLAVMMMGDLEDRRMEPALAKLATQPPRELQIAAAWSLAKGGRDEGLGVVLEAAADANETLRAQAVMALGAFPAPAATEALRGALNDPSALVRIAAAAAALRRASPAPG